MLLGQEGRGILLTDFRYQEQAEQQSPHLEVVIFSGSLNDTITTLARERGWNRLGVEEDHLSFSRYRQLSHGFEGELVPVSQVVEQLRVVKDSRELERMRRAASFVDDAFTFLVPSLLKKGVTEREVSLELEFYLRKEGAGLPPFRYIVASGARGAMPHGVASDKVIQEGEMVTLDFGVFCEGYASDMTRTVAVGEPSDRMKEVYEAVLQAQQAALEGIEVGMSGSQADALARELIEKAGFGEYFGHGLGHGVGLEAHELPHLSPRGEEPLQPGMVFTVEPGVYLPSEGGVRIEDMVVLTQRGVESLTSSPRELMIL